MVILGIETSCDDTCAALVEVKRGRFRALKNVVASQANLHKKYGGVVPEVAARSHVEAIIPVINEVINSHSCIQACSEYSRGKGAGLAVRSFSEGPGWLRILQGSSLESHACRRPPRRRRPSRSFAAAPIHPSSILHFPAIALIVSGGHTELILMRGHGQYRLLGRTRDDAAGECFDKAAKMLGLPYPGGPEISKRAAKGNPRAFDLPRPMLAEHNLEFSFSGMKNAIRLLIQDLRTDAPLGRLSPAPAPAPAPLSNLCASIEQAIVDVLVAKSMLAIKKYRPKTFILAGGVAANKKLRQTLADALPKKTRFLSPAPEFCMDNAAMIALAGYFQAKAKKFIKYDKLKADANWELV